MNQDRGVRPHDHDTSLGNAIPENAKNRVREDVAAVAETAKSELSDIKSEVDTEIGALAEEGQRRAGEVAEHAKGYANDQKDRIAGQLGNVASALHKAARELEQEDATTAGYTHRIADGIDRFTEDVKSRDVDGLIGLAEDLGRKQPGAFMAVAALAGFAASRFLKASADRRTGSESSPTKSPPYGASGQAYGRPSAALSGNGSPEIGRQ